MWTCGSDDESLRSFAWTADTENAAAADNAIIANLMFIGSSQRKRPGSKGHAAGLMTIKFSKRPGGEYLPSAAWLVSVSLQRDALMRPRDRETRRCPSVPKHPSGLQA